MPTDPVHGVGGTAEPAAERRAVLELAGVSKRFGSGSDTERSYAVKDVSFVQSEGDLWCLLGPSGCGKTTVLNIIGGFTQPTSGTLLVNGTSHTAPGPDRAMVFQDYALLPWLTVRENVELGLKLQGIGSSERAAMVDHQLAMVRLEEAAHKHPHHLSGGMQQRVAIARALALQPTVLLMDEPFGALDAQTRLGMQEELERLWQETGKTILLVSHSVDEAIYLSDRVLIMSSSPGRVSAVVDINLPRPRDRTSSEFNAIKRNVFEMLETKRSSSAPVPASALD